MKTKAIITMGLPASGKTTFCEDFVSNRSNNEFSISQLRMDGRKKEEIIYLLENIKDNFSRHISKDRIALIDGLILKNSELIEVIKRINPSIDSYEIHYWNKNIEACLHNDKYRRNKDSAITIKNGELEEVDLESIKSITGEKIVVVVEHDVVKKSKYHMFMDKFKLRSSDGLYYKSYGWSLGGTSGNCWDDGLSTISADTQPGFEKFDEILEEVAPSITYLQHKSIFRGCVKVDEEYKDDYYGGCTTSAFYVLDMVKFVDELLIFGLITEGDLE